MVDGVRACVGQAHELIADDHDEVVARRDGGVESLRLGSRGQADGGLGLRDEGSRGIVVVVVDRDVQVAALGVGARGHLGGGLTQVDLVTAEHVRHVHRATVSMGVDVVGLRSRSAGGGRGLAGRRWRRLGLRPGGWIRRWRSDVIGRGQAEELSAGWLDHDVCCAAPLAEERRAHEHRLGGRRQLLPVSLIPWVRELQCGRRDRTKG